MSFKHISVLWLMWSMCCALARYTNQCIDEYGSTFTDCFTDKTELGCQICQSHVYNHNLTICKAYYAEYVLPHIFKNISAETEYLEVVLVLSYDEYLPGGPSILDFSGISRLQQLKYFHLAQMYINGVTVIQPNWTQEVVREFRSLENLTHLRLRVTMEDNSNISVVDVVEAIPNLVMLDLSYTVELGMVTVDKLFEKLNHKNLQALCLRQIQTLSAKNFVYRLQDLKNYKHTKLTELLELDISCNSLSAIPPGIFNFAPNLRSMDISKNLLINGSNVAFLVEVFLHPTIEILNVSTQGFEDFNFAFSTMYAPLSDAISQNKRSSQHAFYRYCLNIASGGNISDIISSHKTCILLKCLIPSFFNEYNCSLQYNLPNVTEVFDETLDILVPVGENLQVVDFSNVHLENFIGPTYVNFKNRLAIKPGNNLKELYFRNNYGYISASNKEYFFQTVYQISNFYNLELIDLSRNGYYFNISGWSPGCFRNLKKVYLSENNIFVTEFCKIMPNLTDLDLQSGLVEHINSSSFRNCPMLQSINLTNNNFTDSSVLNNLNLNGSNSIKLIQLANSNITSLGEPFFNMIDIFDQLKINLSQNPFLCGCSSQHFIERIIKRGSKKFIDFNSYTCVGEQGQVFLSQIDPHSFFKRCQSNTLEIIGIVFGTSLGTLFLFSCVLFLYSKRWNIIYYNFQLKNYLKHLFTKDQESQDIIKYKYDAFVSYPATDRFWVHDTLMKTLEQTYGFHLCIHYRDFPIGGFIADTISEKMAESREIILIISNNSLTSPWCDFELNQALLQTQRKGKVPISIVMGTIDEENLNPTITHFLQKYTYLQWSEDQKMFWKILVGMLYGDTGGQCCCTYGPRSLGYQHMPQIDQDL